MMVEIDAAAFAPPSPAEVASVTDLGRSDLAFACLMRAAVRASYLSALSPASMGGPDARLGLRVAQERACSAFAARPALDHRELRLKEAVLRPLCDARGAFAAMLRAALADDHGRLDVAAQADALTPSPRRPCRGGVGLDRLVD